jgi:thiol-disulfide isomerase/thioredoxin
MKTIFLKRCLLSFTIVSVSFTVAQVNITAFKVGDTALNLNVNVFNFSQSKVDLFEIANSKRAMILDFWATWCIPCINQFPKLDSLQKKFSDELIIVPITSENEQIVASVLDRLQRSTGIKIMTVINDTILRQYFVHQLLPHYIWLDENRVVKAITSAEEVTVNNVELFLNGKKLNLPIKSDRTTVSVDTRRSFLANLKDLGINDSSVMDYKIMTRYMPNLGGTLTFKKNRITALNAPVQRLFEMAYSNGNSMRILDRKVRLNTPDSLMYKQGEGPGWDRVRRMDWIVNNTYCYEIVVPMPDSNKLYKLMQEDLESKFPLKGSIERERQKCLIIKEIGDIKKYRTNGGEAVDQQNPYGIRYHNVHINRLIAYLTLINQNSGIKIINETNYDGGINLEVNCDLKNRDSLNRELRQWGLIITEEEREVEVLLLRDK